MSNDFQQTLIAARRNLILDAAIEVIAQHGFQRTSIKQIAKHAGVADGTIYNYFKNKEELLHAIVKRLTEPEATSLQQAQQQQLDPQVFLATEVREQMRQMQAQFAVFRAIIPETIVDATLARSLYDGVYQPVFEIAESYLQQLMDQGKLPTGDPRVMARLLIAPSMGLLLMRLMGDDHIETAWESYQEAVFKTLTRTFLGDSDEE